MTTTAQPAVSGTADSLLDPQQWTGRIYGDGWIDAPAALETFEPATGELLGTAGAADVDVVARASASAARAQVEWAQVVATERTAVVRRAAELLERHRAELERWLIRESGSIPGKAAQEITASAGQLEMAAALIAHPLGHVLPSLTPGRTSMARRVPIGVVGVITPWNFPYVLAMRSVGPALALGNAVVLKCDPNTPVTGGVVIARIFEEAGLPLGVLHVLPGGAEIGRR